MILHSCKHFSFGILIREVFADRIELYRLWNNWIYATILCDYSFLLVRGLTFDRFLFFRWGKLHEEILNWQGNCLEVTKIFYIYNILPFSSVRCDNFTRWFFYSWFIWYLIFHRCLFVGGDFETKTKKSRNGKTIVYRWWKFVANVSVPV